MLHLPELIQDLGVILVAAAAVTLLFKKLKQPVVLGYLLAGFLVGPHITFIPTVTDTKGLTLWAEIGVIFLLFGLGLEFSFKKLAKVGKSASITASFEILFMLGAGFLTGRLLGWSNMDSLFLGGILSISSTTIIVRAFDELGLKGRSFVTLVFGSLIVEDLLAILLLVLLTSVAATQTFSGSELAFSSLRLVFFILIWFLLGIYLLPTLLNRIRPLLTDESTLIVSIGLCLLMVIIASHAGFSPALGAFVMGSLLAETKDGHRIEHLIVPVKDLFAAVFFVSVGMLIDPHVIYDYFGIIILVTVVTIFGKLFSTTIGALLSGSSLKNSVQAGMSLAQIGEFSFIIATLGATLKVTSDFLYPVAVAVSAITTFTTPYLIKYSGPLSSWLEAHMPQTVLDSLRRYEVAMAPGLGTNVFSLLWQEYGVKIFLNSVVVVALTLLISTFLDPYLAETFAYGYGGFIKIVPPVLAIILTGPFLWAIFMGRASHKEEYSEATVERLRRLQLGVTLVRFVIGGALLGFVVSQFTSVVAFTGVILLLAAMIGAFLFSPFSGRLYQGVEKRFLSNLSDAQREGLAKQAEVPELAPWDVVLAEYVVSPHSSFIAKPLSESALRERFGVTVVMIQRGDLRIFAPKRNELLLPYDKLSLIGTDEQLAAAQVLIEATPAPDRQHDASEIYGLISIKLEPDDKFVGNSIRLSGIREIVSGLVVGIERAGQRLINPDPSMTLAAGDNVWIVGVLSRTQELRKKMD